MCMVSSDADGIEAVHVQVRGCFDMIGNIQPLDEQEPVVLNDVYYDDPRHSSIKTPSDITLGKTGTDVLLIGHACAPRGKPVTSMPVRMRIGDYCDKIVGVFGDRVWEKGRFGFLHMSKPKPFETMPLRWENAYGGIDAIDDKAPEKAVVSQNPVGRGFINPTRRHASIPARALPNLENPHKLINSWRDRVPPVGFGPVAPSWQPRLSHAGTYDEAWQKNRAPYLPKDFKLKFFQTAPDDQFVSKHLQGGEPIEIAGVSYEDPIRFALPSARVGIKFRFADNDSSRQAALETVLIKPDENRLVLTWAVHQPCDKCVPKLREIVLSHHTGETK